MRSTNRRVTTEKVVHIQKRGKPIALPTGCGTSTALPAIKPNFAARREEIWGRRVFNSDEVLSLRAAEQECDEG